MKYLLIILCIFSSIEAIEYEKSKNVVIDKQNKLIWQDNIEVTEYLETFITAKVYCENIVLNGYIDWRVPTINEILNIIDVTKKNAINKNFKYVKPNFYSTSTTFKENSELLWGVDFKSGMVVTTKKIDENYIRCVRDIKWKK